MEGLAAGLAASGRRRGRLGRAPGRPRQPPPGAADAQGHGAAEEGRAGPRRYAEGTGEGEVGAGNGYWVFLCRVLWNVLNKSRTLCTCTHEAFFCFGGSCVKRKEVAHEVNLGKRKKIYQLISSNCLVNRLSRYELFHWLMFFFVTSDSSVHFDAKDLFALSAFQESATTEKKNLEKKLREAGDVPLLNSTSSDLEVSQLKAEIEVSLLR